MDYKIFNVRKMNGLFSYVLHTGFVCFRQPYFIFPFFRFIPPSENKTKPIPQASHQTPLHHRLLSRNEHLIGVMSELISRSAHFGTSAALSVRCAGDPIGALEAKTPHTVLFAHKHKEMIRLKPKHKPWSVCERAVVVTGNCDSVMLMRLVMIVFRPTKSVHLACISATLSVK